MRISPTNRYFIQVVNIENFYIHPRENYYVAAPGLLGAGVWSFEAGQRFIHHSKIANLQLVPCEDLVTIKSKAHEN